MLRKISRWIPFFLLQSVLPKRIIFYGHVISDNKHPAINRYRYPTWNEFFKFINQMTLLGYVFVSFDEYLKDDDNKKILLTFDDGFKEILDMHKKLKEKKIPYMIFFNQQDAHEDIQKLLDTEDNIFLSDNDLLKLKNENVFIGYHGNKHLNHISKIISIEIIEDNFSINKENFHYLSKPYSFAYPFGAPLNYKQINQYLNKNFGFTYFFDTKAKFGKDDNHFFRVSLDTSNQNISNSYIIDNIKFSVLKLILKRFGLDKY